MQQRKLAELDVSAVGLGCMSMSFAYGTPDAAEAERALNRALDVGYTFLDTASVYGDGHNEQLIGRVLGSRRDEYVLASKCGIMVSEDGGRRVDCTPDNIVKTLEKSLRNLSTDCIDLYYLHRRDHNVPIEESVGALSRCVEQGKIRCIGLSEVSSSTLRKAHKVHPVTAVQSEYSLWSRDPEYRVLDTCAELGVGFVPFSPLGRAMLTGCITADTVYEPADIRQFMPRFTGENLQPNLKLVAKLTDMAQSKGCTPAQLAIAWVLAQRDGTLVPIPGTKHEAFVIENAAASDIKLSTEELAALDNAINEKTVSGPRYAKEFEISLDPEDD